MKIVFLNIYNGFLARGAERSTKELAKRLSDTSDVTLIQGGNKSSEEKYKTITISPIKKNAKDTSYSLLRRFYLDFWSLQILIFTLKAIFYLVKDNYDIIVPVNGGWQTALCKLLTVLKKSKLVVIARAGIGRDDKWNLLLRPDVFVALTKRAKIWAEKIARNVKIVAIPNGVDLKDFSPGKSKIQTDLPRPIILCVGALTPSKKIDKTITAVAKLKNASLLVVGDGFLKNKLQKKGEKLLGKDRFQLTSAPLERMPDYYKLADLFTLVSRSGEAFGNVYLEALATNLAVVATDDESRREIIGRSGEFVDPENILQYANTLQKALKKNYQNKPRKQASKFAWEEVSAKYINLFQSL